MNNSGFELAILLLAALIIPGVAQAQEKEPAPEPQMNGSIPPVGVNLPTFEWSTLSGGSLTSGHLMNHRTVMLLWSPSCPGSKSVVEALPELRQLGIDADAEVLIVSTDSSRVKVREALAGAIPESQVVFAWKASEVLTNPAAFEGIEGPVLKAVVVPAVVLIDSEGIVRSSRLWEGASDVSAEFERIGWGGREW